MPGNKDANYKLIQRFLKDTDLKTPLQRFFDGEAEFVLGDPTEMERANARKTAYVGKLPQAGQLGFWLLTLATPFRGRLFFCHAGQRAHIPQHRTSTHDRGNPVCHWRPSRRARPRIFLFGVVQTFCCLPNAVRYPSQPGQQTTQVLFQFKVMFFSCSMLQC